MKCFDCGDDGHIAPNCPNSGNTGNADRPLWCGHCDRRTRLLGRDEVTRCPACHPLRDRMLPQHSRCPGCHQLIYRWDENPCGSHSAPSNGQFDSRPEREEIDAIVAREGK